MAAGKDIHIPISAWLQTLNLSEYVHSFAKFKGVEELFGITDNGVLELGVRIPEHRNKIVSSLNVLASKRKTSATSVQSSGKRLSNGESTVSLTLKNVGWFHGKISRETAEKLVQQPGDFLVRESISQPGCYVLTSNHDGQSLHFVINQFPVSTSSRPTETEFGFEAARFASIPALINSHLSGGLEITAASGAKIKTPVVRRVSLTEPSLQTPSNSPSLDGNIYQTTSSSPGFSVSPLSVTRKTQDRTLGRVGSVPQLNTNKPRSTASNETGKSNHKPSTVSLTVPASSLNNRARSEGELNRLASGQLPHRSGELKVTRNNTSAHRVVAIRNQALYDDGADYSDYDEVKRMPGDPSNSESKLSVGQSKPQSDLESSNTAAQSDRGGGGGEDYDVPAPAVREIHQFVIPIIPHNYIDAGNFKSELLTNQNKALDPDCMYRMKEVLLQVNHQLISQHITYLDLHLLKVIKTHSLGAGIFSGIEAMTLPQGQHFREAAIERHCCMSFIVSVTILACTDDLMERSQMVKHWILIARELLRSHGNMFSFAAIMHGLLAFPVDRLKMTWNILERCEPVLLNQWKTKLLTSYKELTESASSLALDNVSIPYITPICELLDGNNNEEIDDPVISLAHLDLARLMASQTSDYSRKGLAVLRYFTLRPDLRDLFKVELHLRLLFGHSGALAQRSQRKSKFQQILNILSKRAESNDLGTEF
ncbi:SH2 domain-containing protein 3C-like [Watersipora subatra]|uniref:SH2 domain-containing protein 3C-like n=1 Tax=Watersipora subatra TaxID=2589382 RepID=UPI00355B23EE